MNVTRFKLAILSTPTAGSMEDSFEAKHKDTYYNQKKTVKFPDTKKAANRISSILKRAIIQQIQVP